MKVKGKLVTENNRTYIVVAGSSEYHEQNEIPLGQNEMIDVICKEVLEEGMAMIMELPDFEKIIPFPNMILSGQHIRTTIMTRGNFGVFIRNGMKVAELFNLRSFEPKDVEKGIKDLKEIKKGITKEEEKPKVETESKDKQEPQQPQTKTTEPKTQTKPQEKNNNNQTKPQTKTTETKDEVEEIKNKFKDIA